MKNDTNPFPVNTYVSPDLFCDRKQETELLRSNIKNNKNSTLFAIRRIGKTGLIQHLIHSYSSNRNTVCLYTDILSTQNIKELTNQLATVIYQRFPENKGIGKRLLETIKMMRPHISYDSLSGTPEVSFTYHSTKEYEKTLHQLFEFLDKQNKTIVVAIDEFQQILEYPEKNTEALLRSSIQTLKNVRFIFSGSNQKMMQEIFNDSKRPFFASCSPVKLDFIPKTEYANFIKNTFKKNKRKISDEAVEFILEWTCCHTLYTQSFCNTLFSSHVKNIDLKTTRLTALEILNQNESVFFQYRNLLTHAQWHLLKAIAQETQLFRPHAKEFLIKNHLGTSSIVTRGIESLLEKELIYHYTTSDTPHYAVYDKFLMRWMQHKK